MKRQVPYPLVIAAALLVALAPVQSRLDIARVDTTARSMVGSTVDPGTFVTTVLLAGFRAIAIDIAWVRADYFERSGDLWAVAPALELITDLQPNTEAVWNHIAWNLAYNLSLEEREDDLEARWSWVEAAISTLERGIERNPKSYLIRQELGAWILYAKCVRTDLDEAAPYFARRVFETRGRPALTLAIEYLEEARQIPEHVEALLPLCPSLFHALVDRYDVEVALWQKQPDAARWARLFETRQEIAVHREHIIVDHSRTRRLVEESYIVPELPQR